MMHQMHVSHIAYRMWSKLVDAMYPPRPSVAQYKLLIRLIDAGDREETHKRLRVCYYVSMLLEQDLRNERAHGVTLDEIRDFFDT
jgi:hypothetical protein